VFYIFSTVKVSLTRLTKLLNKNLGEAFEINKEQDKKKQS